MPVRCCGFPWGRAVGREGAACPQQPCSPLKTPPCATLWLPPPGAAKCGKDILQWLCLMGIHWAESSMDYRKITFIKNKRLLAFASALIVFTLKDTGCPLAPVLGSQLEIG